MNKPFDPRLLAISRRGRVAMIITVALTVATTVTVVATALLLAGAIAPVAQGQATLTDVTSIIGLIAVLFALRAGLHAATERFAHRAGTSVIIDLRLRLLQHIAQMSPRWRSERAESMHHTVTAGLQGLEPYFVRYLPQLLLAAILTPATLAVVWFQDHLAAVTLIIVIPLIPLFMWLIGVATQSAAASRMRTLNRLGAQILDLIAGLPTLRAFGRSHGPSARIRELSEAQRRTTMGTLRIAFLSGAALELLATIGVAMVAVGVGLRLVTGGLSLEIGITVIILAPEVLLPLRQVGVHYHASADGAAAATEAFNILDQPEPHTGTTPLGRVTALQIEGISVRAGRRSYFAPHALNATFRAGEITVVTGANGSGKSTLILTLLGLHEPDEGRVLVTSDSESIDLAEADRHSLWNQSVWVPQRPSFEPGTLASLVGPITEADARLTGFDSVIAQAPQGLDTPIGAGGLGLSLGQRQRLALTRAFTRPAQLVIVDEPTAHLDEAAHEIIHRALRAQADRGAIVVVIAHREALIALADHRVHLPHPAAGTTGGDDD